MMKDATKKAHGLTLVPNAGAKTETSAKSRRQVKRREYDCTDLFGDAGPGVTTRVFVLTEIEVGRIKAERVRSPFDPRLRSGRAFAIAAVHSIAACGDDPAIDGVGEEVILRPRIYDGYSYACNFLSALADVEGDCMLTLQSDSGGDYLRVEERAHGNNVSRKAAR